MVIKRYTLEVDMGDSDKHELSTLRFISSALYQSLGEDYRLFTEDGQSVRYDSWSDDGHHEGHDPKAAVVLEPVEVTGDNGKRTLIQRFGSVFR